MSAYLIKQLEAIDNVHVRTGTEVAEACGDGHLEKLVLSDRNSGNKETVDAASMFVFIGAAPRTEWLDGVLVRDERGFVPTGPDLVVDGERPPGWVLAARSLPPRSQRAGRLRGGRRAVRLGQAGRVGRRGRRDGRHPGSPLPLGAVDECPLDPGRAAGTVPVRRSERPSSWSGSRGCGDVVEVAAGRERRHRGRAVAVLLRAAVGHGVDEPGDRRRRRRDHPHRPPRRPTSAPCSSTSGRRVRARVPGVACARSPTARCLALPAKEFAKRFAQWFPMAVHLLEGMLLGMRRGNQQLAERERLLALGKLSAGLTHELNNPAAAAIRATDALRDKVAGMRNKLAMIADGRIAGPALRKLGDGAGRVRQEGAPRARALAAGGLRPGGRAGRLVRRARHRRRLGPRAGVRGGRARRRGHGGRGRRAARAGWWRARSAGWPTRSRARASCGRSSTPPRGSPTSSARRSSTRSSTGRRSGTSTSTRASTPR